MSLGFKFRNQKDININNNNSASDSILNTILSEVLKSNDKLNKILNKVDRHSMEIENLKQRVEKLEVVSEATSDTLKEFTKKIRRSKYD